MCHFAETTAALDSTAGAAWIGVGGGVAAFVGVGSPLNQAFGLGLSGPVTPDDLAVLERFYHDRGVQPLVGVCPLAHPSLLELLSARGWYADAFENVLVRPLRAEEELVLDLPPGLQIREVITDADRAVWALAAAAGFSAPLPPSVEQVALGEIAARRPGARLFLGYLEGDVVATAEIDTADGVAWLSADTTMPAYRRRGIQQALQRFRLALGRSAGCELAVSEASPGSGSQRNMERLGFRVAYTRVDFAGPPVPADGGAVS
jgi:GNAT superfamily N-acetyltransferase